MRNTVADVYAAIDKLAPFDLAVAGDNVGLLVGRMDRPVDTVLTALDATPAVVREARELGAQLLLAHHPLMFSPMQRLDEDNPEAALLCDMVRAGVSMIAAHTNLDAAPGGIDDELVRLLGWRADHSEGFIRTGDLPEAMPLAAVARHAEAVFGAPVLRYGSPDAMISRFTVCSGAGGQEAPHAARTGAQVFITGEIKHHEVLDALARGVCVLACGHRPTELCAADLMANHLQSPENAVELKIRVFVSKVDPFA